MLTDDVLLMLPVVLVFLDRGIVTYLRTFNDNRLFDRVNKPIKRVLIASAAASLASALLRRDVASACVNLVFCCFLVACFLTGSDARDFRLYRRHVLIAKFMAIYVSLLTLLMIVFRYFEVV